MKIKEITYQHRRDFRAVYVCEGCGHEESDGGYDDRYFHDNIIPNRKCSACGKSAVELGVNIRPLATRYPEGMQV